MANLFLFIGGRASEPDQDSRPERLQVARRGNKMGNLPNFEPLVVPLTQWTTVLEPSFMQDGSLCHRSPLLLLLEFDLAN